MLIVFIICILYSGEICALICWPYTAISIKDFHEHKRLLGIAKNSLIF
jgi:hypothetical protein